MERKIKVSAIATCYKNGYKFFPDFFACAVSQTIKDRLEVCLVHYNPSEEELKIVEGFKSKNPGLLNYIIGPKENVASAMNRGIKNSHGQYICIWNIDDLRTDDSFELQEKTLDSHPEAMFTYGDFIMVNGWKKTSGRKIILPEFEKKEFIRSMVLGPYYMWRKEANDQIGYFDEQYNSATDFDFSARLSVEFVGRKTHGLLGYYLDIGGGISTSKGSLPEIERTLVELRYGAYRKVDFLYIFRALKYRLNEVLEQGKWIPVDQLAPHRKEYIDSKIWWIYAVLRYPFWLVQRLMNKLTRIYYQNQ